MGRQARQVALTRVCVLLGLVWLAVDRCFSVRRADELVAQRAASLWGTQLLGR